MSSDTENQINSSQPNFFSILKANVRYHKKLENGAKLLYCELTSLANTYGYCWATNKYFMDVYDVSETTIQNWLRSLKAEGMIEVVIEKKGMVSTRKIYVENFPSKEEIKENSATLRNLSPRHSEICALDTQKSESVIDNNTDYIKQQVVVVARESASDPKKTVSSDVHAFAIRFKKDWTSQEIEEAWKKLNNSSSLIDDPMKYIEGIIQKIRLNKLHKTKKGKNKWNINQNSKTEKQEKKPLSKCNEFYSVNDTSERPLATFARLNGLR